MDRILIYEFCFQWKCNRFSVYCAVIYHLSESFWKTMSLAHSHLPMSFQAKLSRIAKEFQIQKSAQEKKTTISIESYFVLSEVTEGYCLSVFTIISLLTLDSAQKRLGTRSMQWKDGWSYCFLFSQVPCPTSHFYFKKQKTK